MSEPLSYEPTTPAPPPKRALLTIFLIVMADMLGFGLIIAALPLYARSFQASDLQVGLLFSAFSLCQLIATPVLGLASDRLGRRPILLFAQVGSAIGFVILALATARTWSTPGIGLALVFVSRIIDGITGGNISTAQAYVSDVTPPNGRARGMGLLGAAFGIGFTIGPAIGGMLGRLHPSYPAIGAALLSFIAALMSVFFLVEPTRHTTSEAEQTTAWLHPSRFRPILRNAPLVELLLIAFFTMTAFVMLEATFAIYLNDRFGFGQLGVGVFFAFTGIVIILVQGGLIGRLSKRFGDWRLVISGPLLVAAGMILYALIAWDRSIALMAAVGVTLIAGVFNATGRSIQTPSLSSLVSCTTDDHLRATFGVYHMLGSLARVIGPVVATAVYARTMTGPFLVAAGIMLGVMVWTMSLRRRVTTDCPPREGDIVDAVTAAQTPSSG